MRLSTAIAPLVGLYLLYLALKTGWSCSEAYISTQIGCYTGSLSMGVTGIVFIIFPSWFNPLLHYLFALAVYGGIPLIGMYIGASTTDATKLDSVAGLLLGIAFSASYGSSIIDTLSQTTKNKTDE